MDLNHKFARCIYLFTQPMPLYCPNALDMKDIYTYLTGDICFPKKRNDGCGCHDKKKLVGLRNVWPYFGTS